METIKLYIENMFSNLPNTEAVLKAKSELLSMMEDKYNELISDGASENAAVGTVISEFGNLDELKDVLGLTEEVNLAVIEEENADRYFISFEEAKDYIAYKARSGFMVALGVFLCIVSVTAIMICDSLNLNEIGGISSMFGMVAVAVGLFIYNGVMGSVWKHIKNSPCQVDMNTASYLVNEKERYRSTHALILTIGIVLCVICWLPTVIFSNVAIPEIAASMLFVTVGIGVFMIIFTSNIYGSYDDLLNVNEKGTVGGSYGKDESIEYINDGVKLFMELYWSVITSIYLIWSFVTFAWWRTWIIWPIAGIIYGVLKSNLRKK